MLIKSDVEKSKRLSVVEVIIFTILFSGPLFVIYPNVIEFFTTENKIFVVLGPIAAISIYLIILLWKNYFKNWRYGNCVNIHKGYSKMILTFFLMIEVIVCVIEVMGVIASLQEHIFCPSDYIFYQGKYNFLTFIFEVEIMVLYYVLMYKLTDSPSYSFYAGGRFIIKTVNKFKWVIILVNVVLLYLSVTGIVVADNKSITEYSYNNIKGKKYSYTDIIAVDTGFKKRRGKKSESEFYYTITLKNGKKINFKDTSANEKYEDTYTDNVAFDKIVMNSGNVKKTGSTENAKYCGMDKEYVDRLCGVINYKR